MQSLTRQRVLLAITGSIAAYKTPILVRQLIAAGAEVQVVMTAAAKRFVAPMALAAVSAHAVRDDLWDETAELNMGHIELARWADVILVAPASADVLARLAGGLADDLATTIALATTAPVIVAPAMNHVMWAHPATRANMDTLIARGVSCIGPDTGALAERESGAGRMSEPDTIVAALAERMAPAGARPLAGQHVLVSAGPTREALDPVRYLTNHSSGRMGYALAAAAARAGADVCLVSGPTALAVPAGVRRVDVQSAADMHAAVMAEIEAADVFIGAAAVADYRPADIATDKIKKSDDDAEIRLVRTRDIIADVARDYPRVFTLGFAAETTDMETAARDKRARKGLAMIAGNVVGPNDAFGRDDNALFVVDAAGAQYYARDTKAALAERLVAQIAERLADQAVGRI